MFKRTKKLAAVIMNPIERELDSILKKQAVDDALAASLDDVALAVYTAERITELSTASKDAVATIALATVAKQDCISNLNTLGIKVPDCLK